MRLPLVFPVFEPGSVWLTGAGPGDPGLLTLHAVHALGQADAILYDALVDDRVLGFAKPGTLCEFVGKRGGYPSPKQEQINARLVALATSGKRVVRLKGGDPFVFGRGGEEAMALTRAGVPFRVVPGVTAGLAGLSAAGVPATTRDTNYAVILATGHLADGADHDANWAALARTGQPIILYMAMRTLDRITASLIAGGLATDTPAIVVSDATMPDQRVLESTLDRIAAEATAAGIGAPAIVGIGAIVALRRLLAAGTTVVGGAMVLADPEAAE
ncbi:MAG: uroporphyrinogen-III C-methyltransferase [Rhodospirillales bacterium]|nr:uroporphyrinogen-III C-methyltransferase [Rhodospirillales bacterium]